MATRIIDLLPDLKKSSWLYMLGAVYDEDDGWVLSLNPDEFLISRTIEDKVYVVKDGDRLDHISQAFYETPNYTPLLFLLNDNIDHPLVLTPGIEIWIPDQSKLFELIRATQEVES